MEDRHSVIRPGTNHRVYGMCAVFDGHNGSEAADHCSRELPRALLDVLHSKRAWETAPDDTSVPMALASAFHSVDLNMMSAQASVPIDVGTTACAVAVGGNDLWVANAGDSRAVLRSAEGALQLSDDHKPMRPDEYRRITEAGGHVTHYPLDTPRVMGMLNLSRSLGDWHSRPYVIATPEVSRCQLGKGDAYIIVASDGVWDVVKSDEATSVVDAHLDGRAPRRAAARAAALRRLHDLARHRGSTDNLTAILLDLDGASVGP